MADRSRQDKISVAIANEQSGYEVPVRLLRRAAREVLLGEGVRVATISLAVVDDATMHRLNREYLEHDYPTDVLSFLLERSADGSCLDGEIIVSADTADSNAKEYGVPLPREMALYVIHGLLHLLGFDDHAPAKRRAMRSKEAEYLEKVGLAGTAPQRSRRPNVPRRGTKRR